LTYDPEQVRISSSNQLPTQTLANKKMTEGYIEGAAKSIPQDFFIKVFTAIARNFKAKIYYINFQE